MQPYEKTLVTRGCQIGSFLMIRLGYKYPANSMIKHHKQSNHSLIKSSNHLS